MKAREAYFRAYDNQMVMEMYAVRAKETSKMKDQWDIYDALGTVPGPSEDMESSPRPRTAPARCGLIVDRAGPGRKCAPASGDTTLRRPARLA